MKGKLASICQISQQDNNAKTFWEFTNKLYKLYTWYTFMSHSTTSSYL